MSCDTGTPTASTREPNKATKKRTIKTIKKPNKRPSKTQASRNSAVCVHLAQSVQLKALRRDLRHNVKYALVGRGRFRGFVPIDSDGHVQLGQKCGGLTKRLNEHIFSYGQLPSITKQALERRSRTKTQSGFARGKKVDAQLTRIANGGTLRLSALHPLSSATLGALRTEGMQLVCGQLPVGSNTHRLATAVDLVALRVDAGGQQELVLVELKTGFDQGRTMAAMKAGRSQNLRGPLSAASDCLTHRHMAQIAAATALFVGDQTAIELLKRHNISSVSGVLLYANNESVEFHAMDSWWVSRGAAIVMACAA